VLLGDPGQPSITTCCVRPDFRWPRQNVTPAVRLIPPEVADSARGSLGVVPPDGALDVARADSRQDELPDERGDHRRIRLVGHVTVPSEHVDPRVGDRVGGRVRRLPQVRGGVRAGQQKCRRGDGVELGWLVHPTLFDSALPGQRVSGGDAGWVLVGQTGSHRHFRHPVKPGTTTVAGNLGKEVKDGTLANILRQAGLKGPP